MTDVNLYVRDILKGIENAKIVHFYPEDFNTLPVICYYELATTTGFCSDNAEQGQKSSVQIDIYAKSAAQTSEFAIKADTLMQENGFLREMSRDLAPEDNGIRHKTMRFTKMIYFLEEE